MCLNLLSYVKNNKWRLISGSLLAGGVCYYFRDYMEIYLSLTEEKAPVRTEVAKQRLATILASADSISVPKLPASQRLVILQTKLRESGLSEAEKKALFVEFVNLSLARSLSIVSVRVFVRQYVRVAATLAGDSGSLAAVIDDLTHDLTVIMPELQASVLAAVNNKISDPTLELDKVEMNEVVDILVAEIFSLTHRLVQPQVERGPLHVAVAKTMIDSKWRANFAVRLMKEFSRVEEKMPIAKLLPMVKAVETNALAVWSSDYEEILFDWRGGEDAELMQMVEKLAKNL
jgi:hypothetical protein